MTPYQEPHQIPRRGPGDLAFLRLNKTLHGHRGPPLIRNNPGMAHSCACNQTPVRNDPRDPFQHGYMMQLRTSPPFLGIDTRPRDRPGSGPRYHNPGHPDQSHSPTRHEPASSPSLALSGGLSVTSSRATIAWSWTHPGSMRMPAPACCGQKYAGGPLGPIGSERRRAPSPRRRRRGRRLEARWPENRLFGPPGDAPCVVLDHTNLLADLLGASIWDRDPLQTPFMPGARFPLVSTEAGQGSIT